LCPGDMPATATMSVAIIKRGAGVAAVKAVLTQLGFAEDRVWFRFISASEGNLFGETVSKMVTILKKLGPNPTAGQWDI